MKTGRTVLITGAARGMGAESVRRFLDNADVVIATDTSDEALEKLSSFIASDRFHHRSVDITDERVRRPWRGGPASSGEGSTCSSTLPASFPCSHFSK